MDIASNEHCLNRVGLPFLDPLCVNPFHKRCNACLYMESPIWPPSILNPAGRNSSSCGYCGPPGQRSVEETSITTGMFPRQLSCNVYQKMADRGWRRSGTYCYKPDLLRSCCPQYTIRLDALAFEPSRSQRKTLYRFNRAIEKGEPGPHGGDDKVQRKADVDPQPAAQKDKSDKSKNKPKPRKKEFSFIDELHHVEYSYRLGNEHAPVYKFEVSIEPASYTQEKFELFKEYQASVHKEEEKEPASFKSFLCDTCLSPTPIPYTTPPARPGHLPVHYGTHHQLYRLNGELVAMATLDILPGCVSSVYFMYSNQWAWLQLGKVSALREAALAREMHAAGLPDLKWLYMGFYIHSCQKMRYKAEYAPSFLLDPESYSWYPIKSCIALLEKHRYACFSDPSHSQDERPDEEEAIKDLDLEEILYVKPVNGALVAKPLRDHPYASDAYNRDCIFSVVQGLGPRLAKEIYFLI